MRSLRNETGDLRLFALLFAGAVCAFCIQAFWKDGSGLIASVFAVVGTATCGWSWLFMRALFQRPDAARQGWPVVLVVAMVLAEAVLRIGEHDGAPFLRMLGNVEGLVSSALLLMAAVEPLRTISGNLSAHERRFRFVFAAGYAEILAVAVLWVNGAPDSSFAHRHDEAIKATCALVALAGMAAGVWYRATHPLPGEGRGRRQVLRAAPANDADRDLGARILDQMRVEAAYAQPDFKVADLGRILGEAEYKISRCISGTLGFRNFNHMANHFRVAEAKRRLAEPQLGHLPVLTIALDCGFGSIGPFNRAFKAETGMTPMAFRKECRSGGLSPQ